MMLFGADDGKKNKEKIEPLDLKKSPAIPLVTSNKMTVVELHSKVISQSKRMFKIAKEIYQSIKAHISFIRYPFKWHVPVKFHAPC